MMNIDQVDELLVSFYEGTIIQCELEVLFDTFMKDSSVRDLRPNDAAVLIPLALARRDRQSEHARKSALHSRYKAVAAAILFCIAITGTIAILNRNQPTQIHISKTDCDNECAEQWLSRTLQTAL